MGSNGLISRIPGRPNTVGLGQLSVTAYIRTNGFLSGRLPSYQPNHASVEIRMHKSLIPCRSVADSDVQDFSVLATAASSASGTSWSEFSERASGEWEGVLVTFRPDGHAEEIPPYYVPQAYRDWDMQLYDWQAQCSMLADDRGLGYLTRRLMPTVGCEADAIAFEEERQVHKMYFARCTKMYFARCTRCTSPGAQDVLRQVHKMYFARCTRCTSPGAQGVLGWALALSASYGLAGMRRDVREASCCHWAPWVSFSSTSAGVTASAGLVTAASQCMRARQSFSADGALQQIHLTREGRS
eukprot:jgi/Botrbrau1/10286/Bobra.0120s0008.1